MGHFLMHAERALSDASAWIPLLTAAKHPEHRSLEFKLAQLRDLLDRVATPRALARTAC
jgi:hypothetical protein